MIPNPTLFESPGFPCASRSSRSKIRADAFTSFCPRSQRSKITVRRTSMVSATVTYGSHRRQAKLFLHRHSRTGVHPIRTIAAAVAATRARQQIFAGKDEQAAFQYIIAAFHKRLDWRIVEHRLVSAVGVFVELALGQCDSARHKEYERNQRWNFTDHPRPGIDGKMMRLQKCGARARDSQAIHRHKSEPCECCQQKRRQIAQVNSRSLGNFAHKYFVEYQDREGDKVYAEQSNGGRNQEVLRGNHAGALAQSDGMTIDEVHGAGKKEYQEQSEPPAVSQRSRSTGFGCDFPC